MLLQAHEVRNVAALPKHIISFGLSIHFRASRSMVEREPIHLSTRKFASTNGSLRSDENCERSGETSGAAAHCTCRLSDP